MQTQKSPAVATNNLLSPLSAGKRCFQCGDKDHNTLNCWRHKQCFALGRRSDPQRICFHRAFEIPEPKEPKKT